MSQRIARIERLARQVLGEEIHDLKDPRIGFVTVTRVRISADLQHARVLVSVMGDSQEQEATMRGLESAKPHLRSELGRQVRMKYLPELNFELDNQAETAERVELLLKKIQQADGPAGEEA